MKRRIRNILIILPSSVILGVILLTLIFCLPVDSVKEHVKESLYNMIDVQYDESGSQLRKEIISMKDTFTDFLMVQNAMEKVEGKNALEHAMYVYHYDLANETTWQTEDSLKASLAQGTDNMFLLEYSKYWHGYLIWLKPLLMCMSWNSAEIFLVVMQVLLLTAVVGLAIYKKQPLLGIGVVVAFLFMKPVGVMFSLTLSTCWSIVMLALLVDLLFHDHIAKKKWQDEYFLLIGIMTAFMDFLTYPIVTLGLPLCFWIVRNVNEDMHWWKRIKQVFWMAVSWCVGYIGMWGLKWVAAELTVQSGTLRNAVWSIIYRTEPLDGYTSVFTGNIRTFNAVMAQYDSIFYLIGFGIVLALAIVSVLWCFIKARNRNWGISIICLGGVALFPFIWMILTQNHTAIHCFFTFRIMGVSILALWSMAVCSIQTIRRSLHEV